MKMSSILHSTPSDPSNISLILLWNNSDVEEIPKGSLLKKSRPKGVMKVVSSQKSLASEIWQNTLLASSLLKIDALNNCANV